MAKVPKSNKRALIMERKLRRNLILISLIALTIKVFIIFRIQGFDWYQAGGGDLGRGLGELLDNNYVPPNAWYGADGENYIRGVKGLVDEGLFSTEGKLSFWPAGYPILIWPVAELFKGQFFLVLSLLQSILYSLSTIWFVDELRKTRISKSCYMIAILLAFNPTLTLNSISIGYEVPVVSLSLVSIAALIRFFRTQKRRVFTGEIFVASISYAVAAFMQPRILLIAMAFFFTWSLAKFRLLLITPFLITTIAIVSLAPGLLIFRNEKAQGFSAISTNLGVTMRLGAGPGTTGGYSSQDSGTVECPETEGNSAQADRAIVKCVLSWYVNNPSHAIRLFLNKARFFWSPWYGPEANGTMARNPWNQIHPLKPFTQTESGFELQFGTLGKFVSWLWMLSSLALLALGTLHLWKLGDIERLLGVISVMTFLLSLLTSMLTIGDHRFRLPCMGLTLFLQAVGFVRLFNKSQKFPVSTSPLVSWPSFLR